MKKLILISVAATLSLAGSTLLAGTEYVKNADRCFKNQEEKKSDLDKAHEMADDSAVEYYEISNVYNIKKNYERNGSDDEYTEHF